MVLVFFDEKHNAFPVEGETSVASMDLTDADVASLLSARDARVSQERAAEQDAQDKKNADDFAALQADTLAKTTAEEAARRAARTLDDAKAEARARINGGRERAIAEGLVWRTYPVQTDDSSISRLTSTVAAFTAGVPVPDGFSWRMANNIDVAVTLADLVDLSGTVLGWGYQQHVKARQLKAQIDAAATVAEADAIAWL
jgi:hypothetical protein